MKSFEDEILEQVINKLLIQSFEIPVKVQDECPSPIWRKVYEQLIATWNEHLWSVDYQVRLEINTHVYDNSPPIMDQINNQIKTLRGSP